MLFLRVKTELKKIYLWYSPVSSESYVNHGSSTEESIIQLRQSRHKPTWEQLSDIEHRYSKIPEKKGCEYKLWSSLKSSWTSWGRSWFCWYIDASGGCGAERILGDHDEGDYWSRCEESERTRIGQGVRGTVKKWDVRLDKVVGGLTVVGVKVKWPINPEEE